MDFIKKLADIYKGSTVTLTLTFKDEDFSALVSQKGAEEDVLPFSVGGTLEELSDEKFFEILEEPMKESKDIIDNIGKVEKSIKDKEKKVKEKTSGKKTPAPSAKSEEKKKEEKKQEAMPFD